MNDEQVRKLIKQFDTTDYTSGSARVTYNLVGLVQAAYSAGAEQMRERAAELCEGIISDEFSDDHLAKAIRDLSTGESSQAPQEKP